MKAASLIFLLASVCLVHAGADLSEVPVYQNVDIKKLAGKWYPVANTVDTTESTNIISFENSLEPSNEEDMLFKMRRMKNGKCEIVEAPVEHTSEPGIYNIPLTQETVRFIHVEYDSFYMVHIARRDVYNLYLESRTREPSDDAKTHFKSVAETLGFDVNQIIYATVCNRNRFVPMMLLAPKLPEPDGKPENCITSMIRFLVFQMTHAAKCNTAPTSSK